MKFTDKLFIFLAGIIVFVVYILGVSDFFKLSDKYIGDFWVSFSLFIIGILLGIGGFAGFISFLIFFFRWVDDPDSYPE